MEHGFGHSLAPAWALALQASALGEVMRSSSFLYPLANLLHVLALGFFLGPIVLLDLRLLGAARPVPLAAAARILTRVAGASLAVLLATGILMFAADAAGLAANPLIQAKITLILLGAANAALFQASWSRRLQTWDDSPPAWGRRLAAASIIIWLLAATCGRLAAYI